MNRRVFLKGVGGVSLAAPFLPSVYEKTAKAQGLPAATTPKRLVIYFTHNGCLTNRWWPKVTTYTNGMATLTADIAGGADAGAADPLHQQAADPARLPVDERVRVGAVDRSARPGDGLEAHLRDDRPDNKRYATAASLDHVIAKQINPGGKAPLVLSVGAASTQIKEILSFSAAGTPFPATVNPVTIYNQLTGVFGTGGTGGPVTGEAAWKIKRRQSILDLCKADLQRYQSLKMSRVDKTLVQSWTDLLRTHGDRHHPDDAHHDGLDVHPADRGRRRRSWRRRPTSARPARRGRSPWAASSATRPTRSATRTSRRRSRRAATCS